MKRRRAVPELATAPLWPRILAGAALATVVVYLPALNGPFLLDDLYLPFGRPEADRFPVEVWTAQRPVLMATFWLNYRVWGTEPFSYHVVNLLLHLGAGAVVFLLLRRALDWAGEEPGRRDLLAALGAAVFLLHPIQTESVAYIASRSDVLSTLLAYGALAVFVCRGPGPVGSVRAGVTLALLGGAVLAKEHTAVLPAAFVLADWWWSEGSRLKSVIRNWRLYIPSILAGVLAARFVRGVLRTADTAGFGMQDLTWQQYFFTQCRAFWHYVRLLLLPVGQNVDPDFPISRSATDPWAMIGLAAILALVAAALWRRKRFPLAVFGLLLFLLLLAPTSSFLPIKDPVAERRLYLPMIGFLMVAADLVRRWKAPQPAVVAGAVLLCLAGLTYARAEVWSSAVALWEDTAQKSPYKQRPRFQLAFAYFHEQRCEEAAREFGKAAELGKPDVALLVDWALALDCAGRWEDAVARLRQAAMLEDSAHVRALLGMVYGKHGRTEEALHELDEAERLDRNFLMQWIYRGNVHASLGDWNKAAEHYRTALGLEPRNPAALEALRMAEAQLRRN